MIKVYFYKIFFGLLTLSAVSFQYFSDFRRADFSSANFFSYFTIESNIFVGIILLTSAYFSFRNKSSAKLDFLRGGATLYMIITGIVYVLLLANLPDDPNHPKIIWVNFVLHYITPSVVLFDWTSDPPKFLISFKKSLLWLGFPLTYVIYSLIRGPVAAWYPYPFLNPSGPGGWSTVIIYTVVISAGVIIGSFLVSRWGNLMQK